MTELEGVIQYRLDHNWQQFTTDLDLKALIAWRTILYKLGLIGQHPDRYQGLGYGNLSLRCPDNAAEFVISGTQTGHLNQLTVTDFAHVIHTHYQDNHIVSQGLAKPSSEALTHAAVYQAKPELNAVIHVHSSAIWQLTAELQLAATPASVRYGTVAMAEAVSQLLQQQADCRIFTLLGHEDGIVSCGRDLDEAGLYLVQTLALALARASCST